MCSDPFKNRLDGILAAAQESYQEFEDDSGAAPARRIGKLREEYLMLYEKLSAMRAEAQDDIGRQKVDACMEDLEASTRSFFRGRSIRSVLLRSSERTLSSESELIPSGTKQGA